MPAFCLSPQSMRPTFHWRKYHPPILHVHAAAHIHCTMSPPFYLTFRLINRSLASRIIRAIASQIQEPRAYGAAYVSPRWSCVSSETVGYNDNKKEPHRMVGWHRGLQDVIRYLLLIPHILWGKSHSWWNSSFLHASRRLY